MATAAETIQKNVIAARRNRYVGEVVYMFAFDVAYEMTRHPVRELLGQPVAQYVVDSSKRNPRHLFFYRPQMVRLPSQERLGPHGPVRVDYAEGVFIGYRWHDAKGLEPLFPFGHGLGYSRFELGETRSDRQSLRVGETLTVKVLVRNVGARADAGIRHLKAVAPPVAGGRGGVRGGGPPGGDGCLLVPARVV